MTALVDYILLIHDSGFVCYLGPDNFVCCCDGGRAYVTAVMDMGFWDSGIPKYLVCVP